MQWVGFRIYNQKDKGTIRVWVEFTVKIRERKVSSYSQEEERKD